MLIADYLQTYNKIDQVVRQILVAVLKKDPSFLIAQPNKKINKQASQKINHLIKQYQAGWPLAYLLKETNFYHLSLTLSPSVLIPRPETETMVDLILTAVKLDNKNQTTIIDLGTGSGAIILSLADKLKTKKNIKFLATDVSKPALRIAKLNAKKLHLSKQIQFINSYLLDFLSINHENLIIAANLPYLNRKELKEPSIKKEPKLALFGGLAGLSVYRQLLAQLNKKKITNLSLYLEINPAQKEKLVEIIKKNWPSAKIIIKKDLNNNIRFLILKIKNQL